MQKLEISRGLWVTGAILILAFYTCLLVGLMIRVSRLEKIQEYYDSPAQTENTKWFDFFGGNEEK